METCCGYQYDRAPRHPLRRVFQGDRSRSGRPQSGTLCRARTPLSRQTDSRACAARQVEQTTLPGTIARVRAFARVAAHTCLRGSGMSAGFPFAHSRIRTRAVPSVRTGLRIDSPTDKCCSRGTFLHFSLRGSRSNSCYYHQDLHSGPLHACSHHALRRRPRRPPTLCLRTRQGKGAVSVARFSAIHFQGCSIRQVSCYTLPSGFRLPWPPCVNPHLSLA